MNTPQTTRGQCLWIALLIVLIVSWQSQAQARSSTSCSHSLRVGQKLVVEGDAVSQAGALLQAHHRWELVQRSRNRQVWRWTGMQPRTAQLHLDGGRVRRICQSTG